MIDQPSLFRRDVERAQALTGAFLLQLSDGLWHKGRDLASALQTNERVLRQIASDSGGEVIGSNDGYRLVRYATAEEYQHWENAQRSQARKTLQRVFRTRKCFNRGGRAA